MRAGLAGLVERLELHEELRRGRARMLQPQDLPGRYGKVVRAASLPGFEILTRSEGMWPKVRHKDTDITVDILPEGGRPGTAGKPAPTTIPPPASWGLGPVRCTMFPSQL